MKILIIEDEPDLRDIIKLSLEKERYLVEIAGGYHAAIEKLNTYVYDCILLDIMLPDGNGFMILEELKKQGKKEHIIIISAKDLIEDKILGLELGADDYLTKPFHLAELNARIKSLMRRSIQNGLNQIVFGNVSLFPDEFMAQVNDINLDLNRKEYDILSYFMNRTNRLISKMMLAESVWGDYIDQADNFDFIYTQIKNLRKKLIAVGASIEIKSIYGLGYKLTEIDDLDNADL